MTSQAESYVALYGPEECGRPNPWPISCATGPWFSYPHGGSHVMRYVLVCPSRVRVQLPPHAQQSRLSLKARLMPTKPGKYTSASATPVQSLAARWKSSCRGFPYT